MAKMFLAVLALALGSASAFMGSPLVAPTVTRSSPMSMSYETELGAQKPLGFYDPLGLVTNVDEERFDRLRGVEIKHGRVAMLAVLGHLVTGAGYRLPGYLSKAGDLKFSDVPDGLAAFKVLPPLATFQIILFAGFLESQIMRDVTGLGEFPGDFRNGFLDFGWDSFDETTKLQKRAIELNNGRAAMMGILGMMMHEVVTGEAYQPFVMGFNSAYK
mmetsp:Transcript_40257/g.54768  ORF Transcript_40257/g.54768 Transcript_40257/m.54768 type:complete len:216 (-) Transcript_40257:254-901(-)|eukprot:CAMPEP_0185770446 /NCGR_PEP_ID=MMETSP1174-20130828/59130_1 /TAXON_ID=35687 /ORGANISM="Dictyocha speculum, Strain CCMP1381" /LENGTH=215 /DNA_ID=CAMNT_0028455869 /DNA_START=44 /DNA_END=691 /DNA_ORIENTATION=+